MRPWTSEHNALAVSRTPGLESRKEATVGELPDLSLLSARIRVRNFRDSDAAELAACTASAAVHLREWLAWGWKEPQSVQEKRDLIAGFEANRALAGDCFCGIWLNAADASLVGGAGLHPRGSELPPGHVELGYWLHPDHTGRGLAGEATALLIRAAFAVFGYETVELRIRPDNTKSEALAERLGFRWSERIEGAIDTGLPGEPWDAAEVFLLERARLPETPGAQVAAALESAPVAGRAGAFAALGPTLPTAGGA